MKKTKLYEAVAIHRAAACWLLSWPDVTTMAHTIVFSCQRSLLSADLRSGASPEANLTPLRVWGSCAGVASVLLCISLPLLRPSYLLPQQEPARRSRALRLLLPASR